MWPWPSWRGTGPERAGRGLCNNTKCCTQVCPAGIKITDNAIIPVKERSADQRYDPPGRVLRSWRTGRARQDGPAVIPG